MPDSNLDRLDQLLCRLADGRLVDGDNAELEQILLGDEQARERYRIFSAAHLLLGAGRFDSVPFGSVPDKRRFVIPFVAAAAIALIAVGIAFWQSWQARSVTPPLALEDAKKPVLAIVVGSENAAWSASQPAVGGASLHAAAIELKAGTIALNLVGGQMLTLRAPARFELIDEREMVLEAGDASLRIDDNRSAYVIRVPGGAVVDLGAEFSVNVLPSGISDVHVFVGTANTSITGSGDRTREERLLRAGQSVRISKTLERSPSIEGDFVRPLPPDSLKSSPAGEPYAEAVSRSSPLAWWRFEGTNGSTSVPPEAGRQALELRGTPKISGPKGHRFLMTDYGSSSGFATTSAAIDGLDTPSGFSVECLLYSNSSSYATAISLEEPSFNGPRKPEFAHLRHAPHRLAIERMGLKGSKIGHLHEDYALRAMMRSPAGYDGEINTYSAESHLLYRWIHVVLTNDGKNLRLYIDGQPSDEIAAPLAFQGAALQPVIARMQQNAREEKRQWSGGIDEVALYNRVLSAEEVRAHAVSLAH